MPEDGGEGNFLPRAISMEDQETAPESQALGHRESQAGPVQGHTVVSQERMACTRDC